MREATRAGPDAQVRAAGPADLPGVLRLLEDAELPTVGVDRPDGFVVAERGGEVVGAAGLEVHGRDGVLRSVVVAPAWRGEGLGAALTRRVVRSARAAGLERLYLLTTTADDYFRRDGFRRIERSAASAAVRRSVEFREACPASAVAMVLDLAGAEPTDTTLEGTR